MSDKKRTTVTTIETHEVWIIRRVVPGFQEALAPEEKVRPAPALPSSEANTDSERDDEEAL